ncbi:uncharacterized protein LOC120169040 [Hibiscus syriacus]|uniref:uncharacterized protein LOC120169040 n=1 Tax=Hibiscus syriacus TaxID=106335 RepID=UPI0019223C1C|nr:uncharacterized protein LOC120169040 [Hibiscus syriacus]
MELRSRTHLHFVNAIKGGSVEKSMNVGFRGRPALKFREIKEIYIFERHRIIKKRCKKRKRKCSNFVGLKEETMETCSSEKHELPNILHKDGECDFEVPLICLKSKLSKNIKRRNSSSKSIASLSPHAISLTKSKQIHCVEELQLPNEDSVAPVEVEVPDPGYSECQSFFSVTFVSHFSCSKPVDSTVHVSSDVVEVPDPTKESQYDSLNEVSYEYSRNLELKSDVRVSSNDIVKLIPKFATSSSGWEIVKADSPEIISYQCSGLHELGQERCAVYALPYDSTPESIPPSKDCSADLDSFKSNSSDHEMSWQTSSHDRTEAPELVSDDSLQCLENINEGSAWSNESSSAHGWPLNSGISPPGDRLSWSPPCLNSGGHSVPVSSHSTSAGKQLQLPDSVATDDDASDKLMASPGHPDYHQRKHQQQHPERLPSSRKTISPTSQERLCWAMELTRLDEDERQQCRGKLYFGRQTNHRILIAQRLDQFGRDGATIKPKPFTRKAKQDKKGSPPKGILKGTHLSGSVPHVSSACTTAQLCSQSAISFTQRQMRDIESLATKPTELKSMKVLIRIAVESATKAEETARKWLSMMARDCNRFCKIMKSTEDNTAASEGVIQKERKITFADEAGGKLCHVKIFKDDMGAASPLQCGTGKTEIAG